MTFTLRLNSAYGQEGEGPELPGLSAYWNLNSMLSSKYLPGSSTMSTTDCKIDPGGITGKAWPGFCKFIVTRVHKRGLCGAGACVPLAQPATKLKPETPRGVIKGTLNLSARA